MMKLFFLISVGLAVIMACEKESGADIPDPELPEKENHHPFLIVKKELYPALRDKASQEPWKSMKADAISRSQNGTSNDAYKLQEYVGAAALAYILDEANAQTHANRVKDAIINKYSTLDIKESGDWGKVVKPMGSFFSAILSLDIVYDALSIEDILACENVIEDQIFKVDRTGSWKTVRYGTHGTWDIYKGNTPEHKEEYYDAIMHQITPDGVSPVTNHYAWERVGGGNSRVSKSGFMDVLEFTGIDKRYYNNERIQKFQRWLFGSSVNCNKEMAIFGDMLPTQGLANDMLHRRVVNFDMEAAGYAAWFHEGKPAYGHILTYILPKEALPGPVVPSSKIYENGGAFFREKEDDPDGLHAVLYNIQSQDEWHTHNEVNGLALSGLGNRLLVNGGRLGAPTRPAELNNTLTINGEDHTARVGDGIVEGFTAKGLDYALGGDGRAIAGKLHNRNLMLVHSNDGANGYFIVFDEVEANAGDQIQNYLHPANQTTVNATTPLTEYTVAIDHYPTVNGSSVSFCYVTPPKEVNIEKSQSAVQDRYPGYPEHSRLEAVYNVDDSGNRNLATIIFPYNGLHQKADFLKIEEAGFNGCTVSQGAVTDFVFETMSDIENQSDGILFHADFCLIRKAQNTVPFYLVRNGQKLSVNSIGFESNVPVTVYARGTEGAVITKGSNVRLTGSGMENIIFEPSVKVLSSGNGFIEVELEEGTYYFQ